MHYVFFFPMIPIEYHKNKKRNPSPIFLRPLKRLTMGTTNITLMLNSTSHEPLFHLTCALIPPRTSPYPTWYSWSCVKNLSTFRNLTKVQGPFPIELGSSTNGRFILKILKGHSLPKGKWIDCFFFWKTLGYWV
jgi:hypothetical protein